MNDDPSWRPLSEILAVTAMMCPTCWCSDTKLKYLEVRIDTRDNHALLYAGNNKDKEKRVAISIDRVEAAVAKCKSLGMHLKL